MPAGGSRRQSDRGRFSFGLRALVGDGPVAAGRRAARSFVSPLLPASLTSSRIWYACRARRCRRSRRRHLLVLVQTGINRPQSQCHFKGGRGFWRKISSTCREVSARACGPSTTRRPVRGKAGAGLATPRAASPLFARRKSRRRRSSIPFADQQVAHVQATARPCSSCRVFRHNAVASLSRCRREPTGLVETLDGHGDLFSSSGSGVRASARNARKRPRQETAASVCRRAAANRGRCLSVSPSPGPRIASSEAGVNHRFTSSRSAPRSSRRVRSSLVRWM